MDASRVGALQHRYRQEERLSAARTQRRWHEKEVLTWSVTPAREICRRSASISQNML